MFPAELEERYELIRPLGEGGYGSVYLVKDRRLGRELALKVLDGIAADPEQAERFRREARVTSQLQHSNVVQVFDHGDLPGGRAFIGYEYVDGHDLAVVLERQEQVPLAQLLTWGTSIAGALQAAHDKGVTHRDLKPANILLRANGQALLCDFGVARLAQSGTVQTREGLILGTPSYVAPEVWYGDAPGPPADQFALAATLYEVLYRRRPLPSDEPTEIWQALKSGWRPSPPKAREGEYPVLERTLMRGLAVRPKDRYPSVGAFGKALAQTEGTRGFQAPAGSESSSATRIISAPLEVQTAPGGVTRKTLRPQFTGTHAWSPSAKAGAAAAVLVGLGAALAGLVWVSSPAASPPPEPPPAVAATPPWAEQLRTLQGARDRLPRVLQDPPGGRVRHHVEENLDELVDPRVELGLNRFLRAQVDWLEAVAAAEAGDGPGWDDPTVREALVREVLGPLYGIAAVFATMQHYGSRVVSETLDLQDTDMSRGEFVAAMLEQKKYLLQRLGDHDVALEAIPGDHPPALEIGRAFLTLYFLTDFRHPRAEGYERGRFTRQATSWIERFPAEDPRSRFTLNLGSWVAVRAAYMGEDCGLRRELARTLHARSLLLEGTPHVTLEASLQGLVRAGSVAVRVLSSCDGSPKADLYSLLDEVIETLAAHGSEHREVVRDLIRELQDMVHGGNWRGQREKTPEMEARIERLRALQEELGA